MLMVEHFGWVKFDLLGLETLRIIERTIELILKRKKGYTDVTFGQIKYWFDHNMGNEVIDWDDQQVYKVYEEGRWAGIFQCTNNGAQRLFQRAVMEQVNKVPPTLKKKEFTDMVKLLFSGSCNIFSTEIPVSEKRFVIDDNTPGLSSVIILK